MWLNNYMPSAYAPTFNKNMSASKLAKYENNIEWQNTFINLLNIASYTFEWSGLPDTCNERFLELALLYHGRACMVHDDIAGFLTLNANPSSMITIYGLPDHIIATGANGFNHEYTCYIEGGGSDQDVQAVMCRDNNLMYPYINYIIKATDRLMSAMRSIDVASKKLKNPYFITADEAQVTSVKKILADIDNNNEAVITSKSTMPDMFKIFPTNIDASVLTTLWNHYNNLDNQIRTILGVTNNNQTSKRERLLVDEINANNDYTSINVELRLREREKFCEYVNQTFGLNISVKIRNEFVNTEGGTTDDGLHETLET